MTVEKFSRKISIKRQKQEMWTAVEYKIKAMTREIKNEVIKITHLEWKVLE